MKLYIAAALVVLGCASGVLAEFQMDQAFKDIDADKNNFVTKNEVEAAYRKFDTNGDLTISAEEFVTKYVALGMDKDAALYTFFRFGATDDQYINQTDMENLFAITDANKDESITYSEQASILNTVIAQTKIGGRLVPGLTRMYEAADMNNDSLLNQSEFWAVISPADTDSDSIISEMEFVKYWRNQTGDNDDRAHRLFDIMDFDGVEGFGNDTERDAFVTGFDYNKDYFISKEEFFNSMINLFARVMSSVDTEATLKLTDSTYNSTVLFTTADTNNDNKMSLDEYITSSMAADFNGDGMINASEYVMAEMAAGFSERGALYWFFHGDKNSDQVIDKSELRKSFHRADRNRDRYLTMDEVNILLRGVGYQIAIAAAASPKLHALIAVADQNSDDELNGVEMWDVVSAADTNSDGTLAKGEFIQYWTNHIGVDTNISAALFDIFDSDRDGKIEESERTDIFYGLANSMTNDGYISFDEFMNAMLYNYEKIIEKLEMTVRTSLQGRFNITVAFGMGDLNNDSVMTRDEFNQATKAVDLNGDGQINVTEYIIAETKTGLSVDGSVYLFFLGDLNNDQAITKDELALSFDYLDQDDDGVASEQEYGAIWETIQYQLVEASMYLYRQSLLFDWADKNKDGSLTKPELDRIAEYADKDDDGRILSKAEFVAFKVEEGMIMERAQQMFEEIDSDGNGYYGLSEQERTFETFDYDHNSFISWDEFKYADLWLYSRVLNKLEETAYKKKHVNAVVG